MRSGPLTFAAALAVLLLALAIRAGGDASSQRATAAAPTRDPQLAALLDSGRRRYSAYLDAELTSLADRRRVGDRAGARIHAGRVAPAHAAEGPVPSDDPLRVTRAAARVLSLDARHVRVRALLDVESHAAGAGAAFDAVRDALWSRDKGLVGSIDERLATLRVELNAHRRGAGFVPAAGLALAERRRLAAALDALAWRLDLAADRLRR